MNRVLVAGGGVAGVTAAISASLMGAEVLVAEGSEHLATNKSLLPLLISGEVPAAELSLADPRELNSRFGIEVRLSEPVLSVDAAAGTARTPRGRIEFDSAVLCSGSLQVFDDLRGASKQGVFAMRSLEDYLALSRALGGLSRVALVGPLTVSLTFAQAMSRTSRVSVFIGDGNLSRFARRALDAMSDPAASRGVSLLYERVDTIVGVDRAEAVMSGGVVHPCDGVVILPRSFPCVPALDCAKGDHGGVLVDESMRTSCEAVYAAGDCAELRCGSGSLPSRLHSSSLAMGETAGVNAAGGMARVSMSRCLTLDFFGVELCSAGLDAEGAKKVGFDAVEFETDGEGGGPDTSIVYDRVTRRLYGVQMAGQGALALSEYISLAVSSRATLDDLAYHESPYLPSFNREKSPISLTAGRALARTRG